MSNDFEGYVHTCLWKIKYNLYVSGHKFYLENYQTLFFVFHLKSATLFLIYFLWVYMQVKMTLTTNYLNKYNFHPNFWLLFTNLHCNNLSDE